MASEWTEVVLGEVAAEITVGFVGTMSVEYVISGIPFLRSLNIAPYRVVLDNIKFISREFHKRISKSRLRPGDLVIVRTGKPGTAAVIPDELDESNCSDLVIIRPSDKLDVNFLAYYMNSYAGRSTVSGRIVGSVQNHFNVGDAKSLRLKLPPINEQRRIAAILSSFDDKIELNRRMNATLEATARALFKSWFVDFDPVRAKMEGRQPEGMDAETAALFPDRLVESALGQIPEGWRVGTLGEVAEFNTWTLSKRDDLTQIEYIEISEVLRGEIGAVQTYTRGEEPSRARRRLRHGDTVLSTVRPDRGAYFLCLNPSPNLIASTGFAVFTPLSPYWSFLHCAFARAEVFERLGALADGAAYPAVAPEIIADLPIPISSDEVIHRFHTVCSPMYERAEQNRKESRILAAARDALLPKLVSGQVRVGDEA